MPVITQSDNAGNSLSASPFEMDEFLPVVRFKDPVFYNVEDEQLKIKDTDVTLSEHIDSDKRTFKLHQLVTQKRKLKIPFSVKRGSEASWDEKGFIEVKPSVEDKDIKFVSSTKILTTYDSDFEVELEISGDEEKEFYLDFYANDDEDDYNKGEYENVHCGRLEVKIEKPNDWEFTEEKINEIKKYAAKNQKLREIASTYSDYHHCTDTHKHIALILLDNPPGLDLGRDQTENRSIAQAYEKVGESSTSGVRKGLINSGYAEASKIFTVLDIDGKEVVWNGRPGTTDKELSGFKQSPTKFMDDHAPSDGYYVFIGAYDDDFHSFTIVLHKSNAGGVYTFIDQMRTQELSAEQSEDFFLKRIDGFSGGRKYPLMLELYQLRNNNKHEN